MSCRPSVIDSYLATSCDENPFPTSDLCLWGYAIVAEADLRRGAHGAVPVRRGGRARAARAGRRARRRAGARLTAARTPLPGAHRQRELAALRHLAARVDVEDLVG